MKLSARENAYEKNLIRRDGEPARQFALDAGRIHSIRKYPRAGAATPETGHGA